MEPLRPNESDCCNSGCNPCILDVYEEQMKKYLNKQFYSTATEDTYFYTFRYFGDGSQVMYEPGQHFLLRGCNNNDYFTRAYTPIPIGNQDPHSFTILVKLYKNGRMSKYFQHLHINDNTFWRGPYGEYKINFKRKYILLIAQGTGIAPLFVVIQEILSNDKCETFLQLFLCCRSDHNLVLREELYKASAYWNFSYEIFVSVQTRMVKEKYNEIIHPFRLGVADLKRYFETIHVCDVEVLMGGSEMFYNDICAKLTECGISINDIHQF
ncbi:hypothetical protein FQA39_LY14229 [Lamprigera yunnana]|nr:hypothetical protein FQA39_LY14229 [Lamprigera yunnana]